MRGGVATTWGIAAAIGLALLGPPAAQAQTPASGCRPISVHVAGPFASGSCPGVRPGAIVHTSIGSCTLNFLFRGSDGRRYIGTAGHCILESADIGGADVGERTWGPGQGPTARSGGKRIGRFAYAILRGERDFALIRLDRGQRPAAAVCHFGGPTGIYRSLSSSPIALQYFGEGVVAGDLLAARTAIALGTPNPDHVLAEGVATPGDSGSGVTTPDGRAVGVLVAVGPGVDSLGTSGIDSGVIDITRLPPQLKLARHALGIRLRLLRAPLA